MIRTRSLFAIVLAAYLLTGIAQVRTEERAVVRRFGKVVARPGPGLWIGMPWGIDRIDRVPVRMVRQLRAGFNPETASDAPGNPVGQFLTGDQNIVNVQLVVDYAIGETDTDLDDFVMNRDFVDAAITREAEAAAAEWAGGRSVDEVLLTGNSAIPAWLMKGLPGRLEPLHLGVRVQRVSVSYLAPPDEVRSAFEAVTQAQTGIRTRENQALQEADQRMRQAEALKYKYEQDAEVFRRGTLQQAEADAAEFNAQLAAYRDMLKVNPDALAILWWNELRKTLAGVQARGGRVEPLDDSIGTAGLDVTQLITPKRR